MQTAAGGGQEAASSIWVRDTFMLQQTTRPFCFYFFLPALSGIHRMFPKVQRTGRWKEMDGINWADRQGRGPGNGLERCEDGGIGTLHVPMGLLKQRCPNIEYLQGYNGFKCSYNSFTQGSLFSGSQGTNSKRILTAEIGVIRTVVPKMPFACRKRKRETFRWGSAGTCRLSKKLITYSVPISFTLEGGQENQPVLCAR